MEKTRMVTSPHTSAGDAAVSGVFAGLVGGLLMALVIFLFSLVAGQGPAYLGYFSTEVPVPALQGVLMHLAVSCIYGMLYSLILHLTRIDRSNLPGWLVGLIYALALWTLAVTVLLPVSHSIMLSLPWYVFFCGHVAYGLVLGALRQRSAG